MSKHMCAAGKHLIEDHPDDGQDYVCSYCVMDRYGHDPMVRYRMKRYEMWVSSGHEGIPPDDWSPN